MIEKIRALSRATSIREDVSCRVVSKDASRTKRWVPSRTRKIGGIDAGILDGHANALSFFSEAGFRFFLPAYLISDLRGQLQTADPLFHLTHGFSDWTTEVPAGERTFAIRHGRSAFINPRRYGAMTSYDYARWHLSVFTREEANAIVAYLEFKRDLDHDVTDRTAIDAALDLILVGEGADSATGKQPRAAYNGTRGIPSRDQSRHRGTYS